VYEYAGFVYSATPATTPPLGWASNYWRFISIGAEGYKDSLSLIGSGIGGIDVPTTIDSLIVYAACSDSLPDSTSVRVLVYKSTSATPILNALLSGWTSNDEKWRRFAIPFTSDLVLDDPYTVRFDVVVAGKNWVKTSIARGK
jgi:hypothetical protein